SFPRRGPQAGPPGGGPTTPAARRWPRAGVRAAVGGGGGGLFLPPGPGPPMSVETSSGDPMGPRRWNCTLPDQFGIPLTVTVAESLTETDPPSIDVDPVMLECVVR